MALNTDQISVTTSATSIVASNSNRKKVEIYNAGTDIIYLGGDNSVTASNGYPLPVGDTFVDYNYTGQIFGICDTGDSATAHFIEEDF